MACAIVIYDHNQQRAQPRARLVSHFGDNASALTHPRRRSDPVASMVYHNGRRNLYMSGRIRGREGRYAAADARNCVFWRLVRPVATSIAKLARACRVSDVRCLLRYETRLCMHEYRVRHCRELLQLARGIVPAKMKSRMSEGPRKALI